MLRGHRRRKIAERGHGTEFGKEGSRKGFRAYRVSRHAHYKRPLRGYLSPEERRP